MSWALATCARTPLLNRRLGHYLLILAAGLILFMNNLGGPTLWDLDEGRNATAALEMLESGNFVVPTFNAQLREDKPVLVYWLQVTSYRLFGVNEFSARLPSALAALGALFLCYELGRSLFGPSTALVGALILGSTAMMIGAGRFANPDAALNFFITFVLTVFWRGLKQPSSFWYITMGALLGLATLTKGPVGILLPGLIMATFLAWERRLALLYDRRIWYGILALALVALPWYIWVAVETRGAFLKGFIGNHNLNRFFHPMDRHTGSPLYYVVVLLVGMAPWSFFLAFAGWYGIWSTVREPWSRAAPWWTRAADKKSVHGATVNIVAPYRFLGAWLMSYLIFFSVAATKLPNYMLPAAAPLALLTARAFERWRLGDIQPPRWLMLVSLACMAALGIGVGVGLLLVSGDFPYRPLKGPSLSGLEYLGVFGLVPVMAALAGFASLRRHSRSGVVISFVAGTIFFLGPLVAWAVPYWNKTKAPRPLVEESATMTRSRDVRVGGYQLEHLPSLNFYTQRTVNHCANDAEALAFLHSQVPVYLFLPAPLWDGLKAKAPGACRLVARHPDLYRFNDIVVVTNEINQALASEGR